MAPKARPGKLTLTPGGARPGGANQPMFNDSRGTLRINGVIDAVIHQDGLEIEREEDKSKYVMNIRDLEEQELLGKGQYGVVTKVLHRPSGRIMALKEIQLATGDVTTRQIGTELNVLHRSKSPYIVKFYGCFLAQTSVYYCMEYMDYGSLDRLYLGGVPEPVLSRIASAVVQGLWYMSKELNVMHRDVKPTNVLVNSLGEVKLCDFGISAQMTQSLANSYIGCQPYMAPERIQNAELKYGVWSDIWSLGLSLVEAGIGKYPYRRFENVFDQLTVIVKEEAPNLPPDRFFQDAIDFITACMVKDYKQRLTYAQLSVHPFITKYESVYVDMATWARDADRRYRIERGLVKDEGWKASPLATNGYVVPGVPPQLPSTASSASMILTGPPSASSEAGPS